MEWEIPKTKFVEKSDPSSVLRLESIGIGKKNFVRSICFDVFPHHSVPRSKFWPYTLQSKREGAPFGIGGIGYQNDFESSFWVWWIVRINYSEFTKTLFEDRSSHHHQSSSSPLEATRNVPAISNALRQRECQCLQTPDFWSNRWRLNTAIRRIHSWNYCFLESSKIFR